MHSHTHNFPTHTTIPVAPIGSTQMCENYATQLASRMKALGMAYPALAERTGVSVAELKRVISGKHANPTLKTLRAIAGALGVEFRISGDVRIVPQCSPTEFKEQAAKRKAESLVELVQGTMALESQAVGLAVRREMVKRTVHELMAGSPRRVWGP